jgi:DNA-binding NtrC family response regulator
MARILVVDDDEQICAIVSRLLRDEGHEPTTVVKASQAVAQLKNHHFDLVLTDIVMPKRGGIDLIMEIRAQQNKIPIIVMSGQIPLGGDAVAGLVSRYGAAAVLPKPFSADELATAVNHALVDTGFSP